MDNVAINDISKSYATEGSHMVKTNNDFASSKIGRRMNQENFETFSQESPIKTKENFITEKSFDSKSVAGKSVAGKSVAEAFAQRFNKKVKKVASKNSFYKHGSKNSLSQSNYIPKDAKVTDK